MRIVYTYTAHRSHTRLNRTSNSAYVSRHALFKRSSASQGLSRYRYSTGSGGRPGSGHVPRPSTALSVDLQYDSLMRLPTGTNKQTMQTSFIIDLFYSCTVPAQFPASGTGPCARVRPCGARVSRVCPVCVPAPPGVFLPVLYCDGKSESHCLYRYSTVSTVLFKSSQVRSYINNKNLRKYGSGSRVCPVRG